MNPDVISANKAQLKVPSGWQIRPLKSVASFRKGLSILKTDLSDEGVCVISYGQIHDKGNTGVKLADALLRYIPQELTRGGSGARLRYGDLVFADTSEDLEGAGNAVFVDTDDEVFAGYHTLICRLHDDNVLPKFLAYVVNSECWRSQVRRQVSGVKVFSITRRILSSTIVQFPAYPEQQRIVQLLDVETAKIDQAMSLLRRELETMEQLKKSLIYEAVTKGLDPTVPMKPSGVGWIDHIPEHWEVQRLKFVLNNFDYLRMPVEASERSALGDTLFPFYGASGIIDHIDRFNVEGESILISEDGANLVSRSLPIAYLAQGRYWVNNHAHILRPKAGSMRYYFYTLEACDYAPFVTGSAQPKLSQRNLNDVYIPVPPSPAEQERIAIDLQRSLEEISRVFDLKRRQLDLLSQMRQSIIFEYVTGERRVNEVA